MTIAVAVRIGTAAVFAADSKVTTNGLAGFDANGQPQWVPQTFDNAVKVVHDVAKSFMAMVAGHAALGQVSAVDFLLRQNLGFHPDTAAQDAALTVLVNAMVQEKQSYWSTTQLPSDQWPGPTILLASPATDRIRPRIWRIDLSGAASAVQQILTDTGVWLDGSYADAYALLYGFRFDVLQGIAGVAGVTAPQMLQAGINPQGKFLRPIDKISISLAAMPVQDAVDMAVFLADVQIQMDRLLPGTPTCGGPVDVMVLLMAPNPDIVSHPGKTLHHPRSRAWGGGL